MRVSKSRPRPPVRVRHDPPTLEEAVFAAQGLTSDLHQQTEIAAGFMNLPIEEVKVHVLEAASRVTLPASRPGSGRAIVVERRRLMRPRLPSREP